MNSVSTVLVPPSASILVASVSSIATSSVPSVPPVDNNHLLQQIQEVFYPVAAPAESITGKRKDRVLSSINILNHSKGQVERRRKEHDLTVQKNINVEALRIKNDAIWDPVTKEVEVLMDTCVEGINLEPSSLNELKAIFELEHGETGVTLFNLIKSNIDQTIANREKVLDAIENVYMIVEDERQKALELLINNEINRLKRKKYKEDCDLKNANHSFSFKQTKEIDEAYDILAGIGCNKSDIDRGKKVLFHLFFHHFIYFFFIFFQIFS